MPLFDPFLDRLTGAWTLTGQMGATPLHQDVEARWTLGGLFVEMYFHSRLPAAPGLLPYEAVYFIGYNAEQDAYILHLLDTFGVALACIPGVGKREGSSVAFVFEYAGGPFTNRFSWDEAADAWLMELTYLEEGERKVFSTKRMDRK